MSYGDDPGLAVLPAIIHSVERGAGKHLGGVGEVETTFVKRPITFRRIEGDLHPIIIVPPKMPPVERRVSEAPSSIRVTGRWIVLGVANNGGKSADASGRQAPPLRLLALRVNFGVAVAQDVLLQFAHGVAREVVDEDHALG